MTTETPRAGEAADQLDAIASLPAAVYAWFHRLQSAHWRNDAAPKIQRACAAIGLIRSLRNVAVCSLTHLLAPLSVAVTASCSLACFSRCTHAATCAASGAQAL